jgi:hypothetical protein
MYVCKDVEYCCEDYPKPYDFPKGMRLMDNVYVKFHVCVDCYLLQFDLLLDFEVSIRKKGKVFSAKRTCHLDKIFLVIGKI